jgi:hypothetical protein
MIPKVINYFKHQWIYLVFLTSVFVIPLFLYLAFSPYKAPRLPLVLLGVLVLSQYAFYKEKAYRKKIESSVTEILKSEFKRVPSHKEVIQRSDVVVQYRGLTIILTCLVMVLEMLYFNHF